MNQTLQPEQARLAAYYGRGGVQDLQHDIGIAIVAGDIEFRDGVDILMAQWDERNPGPTPEEEKAYADRDIWVLDKPGERIDAPWSPAGYYQSKGTGHWEPDPLAVDPWEAHQEHRADAEASLMLKLDVLVDRIENGQLDAPLAIVRPDADPRALAGLGIEADGLLSRDEINALLAGRKADGELVKGKEYAEERQLSVNPKTGEERVSVPIGSYDFCPTPDKTVSVAWAFAAPVEQAMIYNAHIEAAREAVAYIGDEIGKVRLGKGGEDGTEDGHVVWLEFTHHTSRRVQFKDGEITKDAGPGDPDLHTHFLIPNAVFSAESDKVGSLDTAAIGGFIFEADAFYHARLSQKLRDAGFEVELDHKTGAARMPIIPDEVRSLFSKRTLEGEKLARKLATAEGVDWDDLAPEQHATRIKNATQSYDQKQKGGKDDVADVDDWRRQAKEVAQWEPGPTLQLYGPPPPPLTPEQRIRQAYDVGLPHLADKLAHNAVLKHYDLRIAALRGLVQTGNDGLADVSKVTRIMAAEGVVQNGEKTAIVWGQEPGKRYQSVTTTMHQSDEQEFVRLMRTAAIDRSGVIPRGLLRNKINQSGLDFTDEHGKAQRDAIVRIGRGGRFGVIIAAAGAGKTASLGPLVAAWKQQERDVYGASLAWRQADDLTGAGIAKRNVKAFSVLVDGIQAGEIKLSRTSVVVVDEFGMLGTRQGLDLLRAQAKLGFSVVALGDDMQCASIQAGPVIELSRVALGKKQVPEILTTKRQKTEREREIVGLLRDGEAKEALGMKREDGTAEMAYGGRAGVISRVAKLYAERLVATGEAPGISAPTNQDAHDISAAVRIERRAMGLVGEDVWTAKATDGTRDYSLPLAPGDRVRLFRSTGATYTNGRGGPIGRNGTVLEVVTADANGLTLRNDKGRVGTVAWEKLDHNGRTHLSYGDAMTINTAQGASKRDWISAFPDGTDRVVGQHAYSSLTRHFHASYLVTSEQAERIAVQKRRPLNDTREITPGDTWANVARSFAHQPEKDSATALSNRVRGLRQGGIKAFQQALLPAQPGHRVSTASSQASEVTQRHKIDVAMRANVQVLRQTLARSVDRVTQRIRQPPPVPRQAPEREPSLRM